MVARWKLVQALLREFTEGADFVPLTDKAVVYSRTRVERGDSIQEETEVTEREGEDSDRRLSGLRRGQGPSG